jgi:ADP-ribose pyrophosphatase YjhB (NUDIX family)
MITYERDGVRFSYRVAGICRHDADVLLHRVEAQDFWSMPGGRCELGEPSDVTLRRELAEELGVVATIGPLLYVVKKFSTLDDQAYHELSLYYDITLPPGHRLLDKTHAHRGIEDRHPDAGDLALIFRWFPVDGLVDLPLHPAFLRTALRERQLSLRHVVHWDEPNDEPPGG